MPASTCSTPSSPSSRAAIREQAPLSGADRRRAARHVGVRRRSSGPASPEPKVANRFVTLESHTSKETHMEKLIITVACDSRTSYPHNPLCPPQEDIPGVRAAIHRCRQCRRRDRPHPRPPHARGDDPGRRPAGVAHPSRRLEEAAGRDHEQGRSDHAVRRRLRAHRGEDQADGARPRHDGGLLQRARRIFPAGARRCRPSA